MSRGSGDYAVAFTANPACRLRRDGSGSRHVELLRDEDLSPLLLEADSEAEADPASGFAFGFRLRLRLPASPSATP